MARSNRQLTQLAVDQLRKALVYGPEALEPQKFGNTEVEVIKCTCVCDRAPHIQFRLFGKPIMDVYGTRMWPSTWFSHVGESALGEAGGKCRSLTTGGRSQYVPDRDSLMSQLSQVQERPWYPKRSRCGPSGDLRSRPEPEQESVHPVPLLKHCKGLVLGPRIQC